MIETRAQADREPVPGGAELSSNESPLGPPPSAVDRLLALQHTLHRYPRGASDRLRTEISGHWGVRPESLVLTNGVDEAIDLLTSLTDRVWCTVPGFDAFWTRPETHGVPVTRLPLREDGQPSVVPERVGPHGVVFVARPNNPTGTIVSGAWLDALPDRVDYVCVDETYVDFSEEPGYVPRLGEWDNLCVFRSLSKSLGLAGLRLGVLAAPPRLAARLRERQRFYSADAVSLHLAAAAIGDDAYLERHRARVVRGREHLADLLASSGLFVEVLRTRTNFVVARCPDPAEAVRIQRWLSERGVQVHECSLLGYPGRLRVSVGTEEETALLGGLLTELSRQRSPGPPALE
ncbi:pyridoxal phosphate-dependent aminotransferase [Nocardiopsis sp. NPDC006938]|uniref:pyridoxal phosphate-dependent aminotransferase n=1 Tax=Nocardiopsis sp. NPDC006938 TaxID=3364337 RepID=UPI00367948E6